MNNWKKVTIGDVLKRIKRPVDLEDDKEYKLVTVKLHHKGVELRECKKGRDIGSKMYEVKSGDFILSGIDARNGAFGIVGEDLDGAVVTNDFWYFELNQELIDKHFFLELTSTQWFDEICRLGSDGTTQRIRLQKDRFFNQDIYLPSIEKQKEFSKKFLSLKAKKQKFNDRNHFQQSHIALLRQQILQDAIFGKLTTDWREQNLDTDPASKLLEQIKAEKEKLIAQKKIKKEKPLPKITEHEVPFELPEGWEWCRLGEMGLVIRGKSPKYEKKSDVFSLNQKCVRWNHVDTEFAKEVNRDWLNEIDPDFLTNEEDILVNSTGEGTIGRSAIVDEQSAKMIFDSHILCFKKLGNIASKFVMFLINGQFGQRQINDSKGAKSTKQTELGVGNLKNLMIPLPPCAEQRAIVAKVERLMGYVSQLEEKIANNANNAEILMQAFLGEVFKQ